MSRITEIFPNNDSTAILNAKEDSAAIVALRAYAMVSPDFELKTELFKKIGGVFGIQMTYRDGTTERPVFCTAYHESHDKLIVQLADGARTYLYDDLRSYSISQLSYEQVMAMQAELETNHRQQQMADAMGVVGEVPIQTGMPISESLEEAVPETIPGDAVDDE